MIMNVELLPKDSEKIDRRLEDYNFFSYLFFLQKRGGGGGEC